MDKLIGKTMVFILLFLLIVKPEFVFIPFGINKFFGMLGILSYLGDPITRKKMIIDSGAYLKPILILLLPIALLSICTCLINSSDDFYFAKYAFSMVLGYFSVYLFAYLFYRTYGKIDLKILLWYYIAVCVLYVTIALICFFNSSIYYTLVELQRIETGAESAMNRTEGTRMIGIGANFYTSAVINCLVLIVISLAYVAYDNNIFKRTAFLVCFAIIGVLGMMMARTAMFGIVIGVIIMLIGILKSAKNTIRSIVSFAVFTFIGSVLLNYFLKLSSDSETLLSFAFEMFENRQSGGQFETHSMLRLYDMWDRLPQDISSWLIGNGRWTEKNGAFYKAVDIGYLRDIWYFGLIGTFFVFRYYFIWLKLVFIKKSLFEPYQRIGFLSFCLLVLILNAKGDGDLFLYVLPFYFCTTQNNSKRSF